MCNKEGVGFRRTLGDVEDSSVIRSSRREITADVCRGTGDVVNCMFS